jgi:hypothetical protein
VAVTHDQFVSFFDPRARLMEGIEETSNIVQIEKYYDLGGRELLIVAAMGGSIGIIDLMTFETGIPGP